MVSQHFIVTGGTSGIGLSLVKALLKKGVKVTLIVRNVEKAQCLQETYGYSKVNYIHCDLNDIEYIKEISGELEQFAPYDGFIYSAGMGYFKSIEAHTIDETVQTYQLNLVSFSVLYKLIKPYLRFNAHIVGISSMAAFSSQPAAAHYGASKAGFYQLLNTIRLEEPNYHVLVVNPGPVKTEFHEKADPTLNYQKKVKLIMLNKDKLAKRIVNGIEHKKREINTPRWMYVLLKIYQLNPAFFETKFKGLFTSKLNK
ncbi:SDR family NAD(P)-dependent oxidoreductase [Staphylococcus massiliensis]|uniref:Putative short chain dehydrogenase n=1 Tax=Staphylococcus massiliensis S46 TaxID=1229783 RepID=K9AQV7_9STAP|nr:SDR family NAD(P)-dependent oxidoreductase [Staphylococcus massiliensis]EKU49823.1 putative short chain dehydrogenase [Staphylococcus massiliensis S46]MCG3398928.1 SDR family NAD(P)-dependent oxidoreductase [Staphylococcus massiliensis]MCG3401070.1 SDR family NAD(P)-dependent oxidoreductase [Staphylococcus massiliensis]POA01155.1 KR domain-containing protein [Staphylococcus massiliensis CCUG 55927]